MKISDLETKTEINICLKVNQINHLKDNTMSFLGIKNNERILCKTDKEYDIKKNRVYDIKAKVFQDDYAKKILFVQDIKEVDDSYDIDFGDYYLTSPVSKDKLLKTLNKYVSKIDNDKLKAIVDYYLDNNLKDFVNYPAATTYHHAYIHGLIYHTVSILKLADNMCDVYPFLDRALMYSGIIMHDSLKIVEFSELLAPEYTFKGKLFGHLYLGGEYIDYVAKKLGTSDDEDVLLLKHCVISHHGRPDYGAIRKPQIAEAEAIHLLDTIDSKFETLRVLYDNTDDKTFTSRIPNLEGRQFYIHKKSEKKL